VERAVATALAEDLPFQPRAAIADLTRIRSRERLAMTHKEFCAAFKGSPMERAKVRTLKRNAAAVRADLSRQLSRRNPAFELSLAQRGDAI
jgi:hypothetical protein